METHTPARDVISIPNSWGVYRDALFHIKRGTRYEEYPCGHSGYDANQYRYTYFRRRWIPCKVCIKEFITPE